MKTLSQFALCFFLVCTLISVPTYATQEKSRKLVKLTYAHEPVEIVGVSVDRHAISLDAPFASDDAWVKGLLFKVRNNSPKAIAYLSLDVDIPLTGYKTVPAMRLTLSHGVNPNMPGDYKEQPLNVQPGQSVELAFDVSAFMGLKQEVEKEGGSVVTEKVSFSIGQIIFDDDSAWGHGRTLRRDQQNPMRWEAVGVNEKEAAKGGRNTQRHAC